MSLTASQLLFPVPHSQIVTGFTTARAVDIPSIRHVSLADDSLGVHKVSSSTSHNLVRPPVPPVQRPSELAWEALFPAGSINPGNKSAPPGGFGFYLRGPPELATVLREQTPKEVLMSYAVMFENGWGWRKGGKLPGIYGGVGDSAYGCTGGRQTDRCKCFNLRLMWREDGTGELYAYLPVTGSNAARLLEVPPRSLQHPDYGFSVGRGAWRFVPGRWISVAQRVRMNELGQDDGEIEVFIDGQSVISVTGLTLRTKDDPDGHVQGLHFQTFFGGHTAEWGAPKDQHAWFTCVSGAVLRAPVHLESMTLGSSGNAAIGDLT